MKNISPLDQQLGFFERGGTGCKFAALAATNPAKYGWSRSLCAPSLDAVEEAIVSAIESPQTTTMSLVFTQVLQPAQLVALIKELRSGKLITLGQNILFNGCRCLGLRVHVSDVVSWVSGFGPFSFLPKTRQSPYASIVFRVKSRPQYDWYLKPPHEGVIHLADMNMIDLSDEALRKLWGASFVSVEQILGAKPDLLSAAKTTFAIPDSECAGL